MKMPTIFLSPSTQDFNPYVTRGNEEYWMNILADRIMPYLLASGIGFGRNDRDKNAAAAIAQSNRGDYDFHLSLHSNASPAGKEGQNRGIIAYYYPGSPDSLRMAEILVDNLQTIYPLPEKVKAMPTVNIGEVRRTRTSMPWQSGFPFLSRSILEFLSSLPSPCARVQSPFRGDGSTSGICPSWVRRCWRVQKTETS